MVIFIISSIYASINNPNNNQNIIPPDATNDNFSLLFPPESSFFDLFQIRNLKTATINSLFLDL